MKKKYLSPKSEVIAFALESLMLSTSLPTKDELGADQLSSLVGIALTGRKIAMMNEIIVSIRSRRCAEL